MTSKKIFVLALAVCFLTGCLDNEDVLERRQDQGLSTGEDLYCEELYVDGDAFDKKYYDPLKWEYRFENLEHQIYEAEHAVRVQMDDVQLELAKPGLSDAKRKQLEDRLKQLQQQEQDASKEFTKLLDPLVSAHVCYGLSAIHVLEACEETVMKERKIDRDFANEICSDCYTKARKRHCEKKGDLTLEDLHYWSYTNLPGQTSDLPPSEKSIRDTYISDPFLWDLPEAEEIIGDPCEELKPYQKQLEPYEEEYKKLTEDLDTLDALITAQRDIVKKENTKEARKRLAKLEKRMEDTIRKRADVLDEAFDILNKHGYRNLKGVAKKFDKDCGKEDDLVLPPLPGGTGEPLPGTPTTADGEFTPFDADPILTPPSISVEQLWVDTFCGGSVYVVGQLGGDLSDIREVSLLSRDTSLDYDEKRSGFDPTSGAFNVTKKLKPGKYEIYIAVKTKKDGVFTQLLQTVVIEPCDKVTPEPTPDTVIDTPPQTENSPAAAQKNEAKDTQAIQVDTSTSCGSSDACTEHAVHGFPVCNENVLPKDCQPTDNRPGWDCYTFEDATCSPSLRCFCITPPEDF